MAMKNAAPIQRRKLYHEVAERIAEEISNGTFAPGDRLPSERDLMSLFGVGRPAIREAMQWLDQKGLIIVSHGERARVATLDAHAIDSAMSSAYPIAHRML